MIPYLHLGPLQIPTFGLMVALALITSAYILQADFDRRGMAEDAFTMITVAGLMGILGAKLYHLLDSEGLFDPQYRDTFFTHLWSVFFTRYGFAWFGGFLGGFGAMLFMGWRDKLPTWTFLDACSPAACFGYAIGRIGCLLSGDGDYGKPTTLPWGMSFPNGVVPTTERVHPAPLYEFLIWSVIGLLLWQLGAKAMKGKAPSGRLFCYYLILTGIARFLVEIIRINPPWILGLSNAQVASVFSIIVGLVLFFALPKKIKA